MATNPSTCIACDGSGYLDVYADHLQQCVSTRCPDCGHGAVGLHLYQDRDHDGWLDGLVRVPARYAGGWRSREDITMVVLHRLVKGWHARGPEYVANPGDGRIVSWAFTVHNPGWERFVTQHLPITQVAYHARGFNRESIGVELDGPAGTPYHPDTVDELVCLLDSLKVLCPRLSRVVSHRSLSPDRRSDPDGFPWEALDGLGLGVEP